ncbi:MAG: zinc-ribbon domain-containing protein [Bacteroidaceae bacterium]|nr:zinc-ribbon domain-containing protein [Bacteroidaceae bacterium]
MHSSFCPKCGQPLQSRSSFCPNCGNRVMSAGGPTNQLIRENSNKTVVIVLLAVIIGLLVAGGLIWAMLTFKSDSSSTSEAVVDSLATPQIDTTSSANASPAISDSQISVEPPVSKYPPLLVVAGDNVCLRSQPNENSKLTGADNPHLFTGEVYPCAGFSVVITSLNLKMTTTTCPRNMGVHANNDFIA